jgi:hypothetical protein
VPIRVVGRVETAIGAAVTARASSILDRLGATVAKPLDRRLWETGRLPHAKLHNRRVCCQLAGISAYRNVYMTSSPTAHSTVAGYVVNGLNWGTARAAVVPGDARSRLDAAPVCTSRCIMLCAQHWDWTSETYEIKQLILHEPATHHQHFTTPGQTCSPYYDSVLLPLDALLPISVTLEPVRGA